ncbi:hypothetical protein MESS2_300078 [Mesorhizobium metallidurans STM 2683]|uniref:Transposase n=1 Tax=Mesorhizobium metallidurans STM 2683 TaxID=1297569 RepID=M5EQJ0_9HYPH|nr:hypothetical protein MESS2_300078 [Mesorhizobium metallidurans STM 2683]
MFRVAVTIEGFACVARFVTVAGCPVRLITSLGPNKNQRVSAWGALELRHVECHLARCRHLQLRSTAGS